MLRVILLVLLNLFGYNSQSPVRLQKKLTWNERIRIWVEVHEYELLLIITILMIVVFVLAVFALVPPLDMWNKHLQDVI